MGDCITYTHLKKFRKILNLNVLKFHANWKKVADGSHGSCNQNKGKLQNSWAVSWPAPRSVASKHLHPGNPRQSWSADSTSKPRNLIAQVMCQVASYEWRETKLGWQHNVPPSHNRKKGRRAHRWCLRAPDTLFRPPARPTAQQHGLPKIFVRFTKTATSPVWVSLRPRRSSGKKTVEILARSSLRT